MYFWKTKLVIQFGIPIKHKLFKLTLMKKTLLFVTLLATTVFFAQTQPTVHNATFDNIAKNDGKTCHCSGWINKDIADQAESSTKDSNSVIKFDMLESDGIYQEVAVEANSNYTLDLEYWYSSTSTTTQYIEVLILKGSEYKNGYTPIYAAPADAAQLGFGYETVASVDNTNNHVARTTIVPPADTNKNAMTQLTFNTGAETSIAIFVRAVGPYAAGAHGDPTKNKGWMSGDKLTYIDNLALVNLGATASVDDVFSSKVSVYPNPANEFLNISSSVEINKVEVYNLLGKKVLSSLKLNDNNLNISSLANGIYMIKLTSGDSVATKKIIKN